MKFAHLLVAGTALVSASALAAGEQKDSQAQQQPTQSMGASSSSSSQGSSAQGASQGAAAQQHDQETVKQVQQKLSQEGIDVGPVDGIMGPKTQAALKEYQQKNQLEATGRLDQETLAELGVEAGGSSSVGASGASGSSGASSSQGGGMKQEQGTKQEESEKPQSSKQQ